MISIKQESVLLKKLKSLSELEMDGVLKELSEHLFKNNQTHLLDNRFRDFQSELEELENEFDELNNKFNDAIDSARSALSILKYIENIDDDVQKDIDKAIDLLSEII